MKIKISRFLTFVLILFIQNLVAQLPLHYNNEDLPCVERKFHFFIHVTLDSLGKFNMTDAKIQQMIQKANDAFAPICISFDYCKIDTVVDYSFESINSNDEVELIMSRFQKKRRINLYLTENGLPGYENSYSTFNGINDPENCAIIIPKSGRGLIHELGHTFGLHHIFESKFGVELANGSNCDIAGDLICDTPACPEYSPNKECLFPSNLLDPNDEYYRAEVSNYMSHFFCAHCFFTKEQYKLMAKNFINSVEKIW
jgi:hypothetical protein